MFALVLLARRGPILSPPEGFDERHRHSIPDLRRRSRRQRPDAPPRHPADCSSFPTEWEKMLANRSIVGSDMGSPTDGEK
jgi:hypothetical protein